MKEGDENVSNMFLSKMSFLDSVEQDPTKNAPCLYSVSIVFWNGCDI
jgi:hypothetical protein